MSYARFGCDDSDVYVYAEERGFCCCWCHINEGESLILPDTDAIIAHLKEHIAQGSVVPAGTIEEIEADREENEP